MTLFIAALLIYQFNMNPWLYVAAVAIWLLGFVLKASWFGNILGQKN